MATVWSIPEMVAKAIRLAEEKPTVLLIDDFHMVSPHLQAYFYGLLLERRLGNYKLSDNIAIVLTMNDTDSAGFHGINSAVRNRMSILPIKFNFEYWFNNFGNRLHYLVASFLKAHDKYCSEPESTGVEGYATARAWTAISAELNFHEHDFILSQGGVIAGMQVSQKVANAFNVHVNYVNQLDFVDTVKNRILTDLSQEDSMKSIIYAYIANFIVTMQDGEYLFDLINENLKDSASAFAGYLLGELYVKYTSNEKLSEGIQFVIDRIIDNPINKENYPLASDAVFNKLKSKPLPNLDTIRLRAAEYLN